ncbi:superoxide dismutase [Cu-Zn]-like isoform X2 [Planococcus citri]|uniref:superoxide dismutase [Cu-Zn]-like isoform X2 n=1 Tax=Planococcus citri TaxID=170843 RepID=UPI0031F79E95
MYISSVLFSCALVFITVTAQQERKAIAVVRSVGSDGIKGNITFTQTRSGVLISGTIAGLSKGHHGFHIHEKGDLSNGCVSTGGHFNPDKKNHGSPSDKERHVGDLGNIEANDLGVAVFNYTDERISLINTKRNILGRAVVVHADRDDLGRGGETDSLTTGHAGGRLACGVIGTLDVVANQFECIH